MAQGRVTARGAEVSKDKESRIGVAPPPAGTNGALWLVALSDPKNAESESAPPAVWNGDTEIRGQWLPIANHWWLFRGPIPKTLRANPALSLRSDRRWLITTGRYVLPDSTRPAFDGADLEEAAEWPVPVFSSRWAAQGARMYVSRMPPDRRWYTLAFLVAPHEYGPAAEISLGRCSPGNAETHTLPTGRFVWEVWTGACSGESRPAECLTVENRTVRGQEGEPDAAALGHLMLLDQGLEP